MNRAVSAGENIAVIIPQRKGGPAQVRVYTYPDFENPKAARSFFKVGLLHQFSVSY